MGLILNRPLQATVREACEEKLGEDCFAEGVLYQGGPCEGPLMVLHGNEMVQDSEVLPGIFFTTEKTKIEAIMKQGAEQTRYFVGYAGWSPGQLEAELEVESWTVLAATDYHVFSSNESLWDKLMTCRMLTVTVKWKWIRFRMILR